MIAKKIEGQGSAIDIGNGLPAILNGLVELVEEATAAAAAAAPKIIVSNKTWDEVLSGDYDTKALLASALGISETEVDNLSSCDELKLTDTSLKRSFTIHFGDGIILFGGSDGVGNYGYSITINGTLTGSYTIEKIEI